MAEALESESFSSPSAETLYRREDGVAVYPTGLMVSGPLQVIITGSAPGFAGLVGREPAARLTGRDGAVAARPVSPGLVAAGARLLRRASRLRSAPHSNISASLLAPASCRLPESTWIRRCDPSNSARKILRGCVVGLDAGSVGLVAASATSTPAAPEAGTACVVLEAGRAAGPEAGAVAVVARVAGPEVGAAA